MCTQSTLLSPTELELARIPSALEAYMLAYKAEAEVKLSEAALTVSLLELVKKRMQDYYASKADPDAATALKSAQRVIRDINEILNNNSLTMFVQQSAKPQSVGW